MAAKGSTGGKAAGKTTTRSPTKVMEARAAPAKKMAAAGKKKAK